MLKTIRAAGVGETQAEESKKIDEGGPTSLCDEVLVGVGRRPCRSIISFH